MEVSDITVILNLKQYIPIKHASDCFGIENTNKTRI